MGIHALLWLAIVAATVSGLRPQPSSAQELASRLDKPQGGYYRLKVGDVEVIALSDGTVPFPAYEILRNTNAAEVNALLAAADARAPFEASMNAYLVVLDKRVILVDTGTGDLLGPTPNMPPKASRSPARLPTCPGARANS